MIIVAWDSKKHLPACLNRLLTQTFHKFEVILVDNGSQDGAVDRAQEAYLTLDLRVEKLNANLGFAAANNIGARLARGTCPPTPLRYGDFVRSVQCGMSFGKECEDF